MKIAKVGFGVVALFSLVVGACGGGDSSPAPIGKEAFIQRADRLCAEANEKLDALAEPQTIEQLGGVLQTGATTTRKLLADLRALGTPTEGRETLERMYALVEQGLAKFEAALAAVPSGDTEPIATLADEGQALFGQANTAAESYGFKDCAE